jgi:DNA-directed RNA polymerase subunit L
MSLKLTAVQKEKLRKLDEEMKRKKEHDEKSRPRREASSKATGIPVDIVDMDVIKVGTLLGLIKKKAILEGKEPNTTGSLLNMFLGGEDDFKIDRSKIPHNFRNAPTIATEADKISYHQQYVQQQCQHLSAMTMSLIKQEMANINRYICVNIETNTIDNLKTACIETIDVLLEELCGDDEDDDELWSTLSIVRNALLGMVDICKYKKMLNEHIVMLRKAGKAHSRILGHLSVNDVRLSLYKGCLAQTKGPLTSDDSMRLSREIELRCYMKPPELKPFNFEDIVRHCCIPSLVCIPVDEVIEKGLVGPYRNNSIGYLDIGGKQKTPWSFYNLKSINPDGVRLWVLDNTLWALTDNMISTMTAYMIKTFRTFYHEYYGTNTFKTGFWLASHNNHYDAFINMMNNFSFISNHTMFHNFLMMILVHKSPLIPTDYDFFNHLVYYDFRIMHEPYLKCFENNMKQMFDDLNDEHLSKLKTTFVIPQKRNSK